MKISLGSIFGSKEQKEIIKAYQKLAVDITDNFDKYSPMHKLMVKLMRDKLGEMNSILDQYDKDNRGTDNTFPEPTDQQVEEYWKNILDIIFGKDK